MCGVNKPTGKMELVLLPNEWTLLFSHGTFQRHVFFLIDSYELQEIISIVS